MLKHIRSVHIQGIVVYCKYGCSFASMESNPHNGMDVENVQRSGLNIATMLALAALTDAVVSAYIKP